MKIIIYERNCKDFFPLINLYPQFNLRIGMKTIAEHILYHSPEAKIAYMARDLFKIRGINPKGPTLYLSSQSIITQKIVLPKEETKFTIDGKVAGFLKYRPPFPKSIKDVDRTLINIKKKRRLSGYILNNLWDLIKYNQEILTYHYKMYKRKGKTTKGINIIGNKRNLEVAQDAAVHKFVTMDVSEGPIYIDKNAVIRPFTTIVGPSYIGPRTIIDRAKIVKSSIGPMCRIGGEVESSIFQGYSNKCHNGFIGHSFIGEWVNFGALTTNSDLKNNYSSVRLQIDRKERDSGMMKLGCFVGDHTKTGIGTLIPTGAVIGSFVNFFGGGMMPRYVSCFKWLMVKKEEVYQLKKAIETAKVVMRRRNIRMSKQYENLIRTNYKWRNLL